MSDPSLVYSLEAIRQKERATRDLRDPERSFPANPEDPLAPLYVSVEMLFREAAQYTSEWWVKADRLPAGRAILEHRNRHDAFLAVVRWCGWGRRASRRLDAWRPTRAEGRPDECLGNLADTLARGDANLTEPEITELLTYGELAHRGASAFFPSRALVWAIDYYSRRASLPQTAIPVLREILVQQALTNHKAFRGSLRRIDVILTRAGAFEQRSGTGEAHVSRSTTEYGDSAASILRELDRVRDTVQTRVEFTEANRLAARVAETLPSDRHRLALEVFDRLAAWARSPIALPNGYGFGPYRNGPEVEYWMLVLVARELLKPPVRFLEDEWLRIVRAVAEFPAPMEHTSPYLDRFVSGLEDNVKRGLVLTEPLRDALARVTASLQTYANMPQHHLARRLMMLTGERDELLLPRAVPWCVSVRRDLAAMTPSNHAAWRAVLEHAATATGPSPSKRWSSAAVELLAPLDREAFQNQTIGWLRTFTRPDGQAQGEGHDARHWMLLVPLDLIRGLCWFAAISPSPDMSRCLGATAVAAYRKIPGIGPWAVKVGNAAVYALGQMPGPDALGQLAMLRVKVKFGTAQKGIEKALNAAAAREGLPRDEIEELGIPTYGLTEVGLRREQIGDYTAELAITGIGDTELRFVKRDSDGKPGKAQKSVPAAVKKDHADDLKELKAAAKDIAAMLPAQRDRIDSLFLDGKSWAYGVWRERYLDHPLVGVLARRLIWRFSDGKGETWRSAAWLAGGSGDCIVDARGEAVTIDGDSAIVRLWHPIDAPQEEVLAWRGFYEQREIRQPFKQAHREVYLLTDAERRTGTYSNRFAAHVLKQHQFHALCGVRNWRNKLRLLVDAEYPPASRTLAAHGLRAEFWIEGAGSENGQDTNESGAYLYLTTDQVRFYRIAAAESSAHAGGGGYRTHAVEGNALNEPLPLEQVPPLVLSEVMRDVDLFVGVCSVGNNPQWADGGPEGRYLEYWNQFAWGDLGETGRTRRDVLARLLPRLKIAGVCSLTEKFLMVNGKMRTYKIHLGSGNILMEPNDQYLCIVASSRQGAEEGGVFLPFEGDRTLAIILSKAFMLAADDEIKDPSILSQIGRRK